MCAECLFELASARGSGTRATVGRFDEPFGLEGDGFNGLSLVWTG